MRKSGGAEGAQSRGGAVVVVVVGVVVVVVEGSAAVAEGPWVVVVVEGSMVMVVEGSAVAEGVEEVGGPSSEMAVLEQDSKTSRPTATGRNGRRRAGIPVTRRRARTGRFAGE